MSIRRRPETSSRLRARTYAITIITGQVPSAERSGAGIAHRMRFDRPLCVRAGNYSTRIVYKRVIIIINMRRVDGRARRSSREAEQ